MSDRKFHLFPGFPAEIRLAVWRFCLPHRIVELDYQQDEVIWDEPPCRRNSRITSTNKAPPVIASVCRESRAVAFESGCPEPLPSPNNEDAQDFNYNMVRNRWLDTTRDFVHINWDPFYDIEWQSYDWGDPPHDHYRWTRSELADLLRTNPSWTVIILPPVIVHADAETAAGLFGLLADARVQLVAADDKARIEEFLALDTAPNTTIGAGVGPEDLVSAKLKLRDAIDAVFGSEDSAPVMRPAVMFRLCTGRCP